MPSLSFASQASILRALFQGKPLPSVSTLYVGLHTANPGGLGTQSTNETSYSNYARVAVPCSPGSWAVFQADPAQTQNIQAITFPACGLTGDTLSFWSIGYDASGPGQLITSGPIGPATAYGFTAISSTPGSLYVPLLPPGMVVNQPVVLYQFGPGMLLPGGLVEGQVYLVGSIVGQFLTLSSLPNNAAPVATILAGSGLLLPVSPLVVTTAVVPTFPSSSLLTFMN